MINAYQTLKKERLRDNVKFIVPILKMHSLLYALKYFLINHGHENKVASWVYGAVYMKTISQKI